jgi:hypothetical protein
MKPRKLICIFFCHQSSDFSVSDGLYTIHLRTGIRLNTTTLMVLKSMVYSIVVRPGEIDIYERANDAIIQLERASMNRHTVRAQSQMVNWTHDPGVPAEMHSTIENVMRSLLMALNTKSSVKEYMMGRDRYKLDVEVVDLIGSEIVELLKLTPLHANIAFNVIVTPKQLCVEVEL